MDIEIASGVNKVALNDFAKRDIVQRGEKRVLDARQNVTLTRELRACLDELADDKAA